MRKLRMVLKLIYTLLFSVNLIFSLASPPSAPPSLPSAWIDRGPQQMICLPVDNIIEGVTNLLINNDNNTCCGDDIEVNVTTESDCCNDLAIEHCQSEAELKGLTRIDIMYRFKKVQTCHLYNETGCGDQFNLTYVCTQQLKDLYIVIEIKYFFI
jgi:hypothetical protein